MSSSDAAMMAGLLAYYVIILVISLVWLVISVIAMWRLFEKAGIPGWASIVPFYGLYCLYKISIGNGWFFLLSPVPCVGLIIGIIMNLKLAKAFGKGTGFGIGLILLNPIFMLILGFGSDRYQGVQ